MKALFAVFLFTLSSNAVAANADLCINQVGDIAKQIRSISVWDVAVTKVEFKKEEVVDQQLNLIYEVSFDVGAAELRLDQYCLVLGYKTK